MPLTSPQMVSVLDVVPSDTAASTLTRSPTASSGERPWEESSDRAMATWPSSIADVMCAGEADAWMEESEMDVPAVWVVMEVCPATSETFVAASVGQ